MLLGPRRQADLICSYYDMDVISCNFCFLFWSYLMDGASSCCILVLLISVLAMYNSSRSAWCSLWCYLEMSSLSCFVVDTSTDLGIVDVS